MEAASQPGCCSPSSLQDDPLGLDGLWAAAQLRPVAGTDRLRFPSNQAQSLSDRCHPSLWLHFIVMTTN